MLNALSLFSSAGIAEYYLEQIGINVVLANELVKNRAETHSLLYKNCNIVNGDITNEDIQNEIINSSYNKNIRMIIATPPCQGLSWAGANKTKESLLNDPRNYLILSALRLVDELQPDYFIVENVPRFEKMVFPVESEFLSLEELLKKKYYKRYNLDVCILNAADYGVPQTRLRIVYRMWKKELLWRLPHKEKRITLFDAIGDLPSLEPGEKSEIVNHYARLHPDNHIECMKHTPTGCTAYNNEVYYPRKKDGSQIKGFKNTYKRMRWDVPAPTITMRNEIISSQENVHPGRYLGNDLWSDPRVLTLRELLIVSSLPPDINIPSNLSETSFRHLIGEGVPPLMLKSIMKGIGELNE